MADGSISGSRFYSLNIATTEMCINAKDPKVYLGYYSNFYYSFTILDLTGNQQSSFRIAPINKIFDVAFVPSDGRLILGGSINNLLNLLTITTPESTLDTQVNITDTTSAFSLITTQYPISTSTTISVNSASCTSGCFNSFSSPSTSTCAVQAPTYSLVNYFLDPIYATNLPTNSHVVKSLTYSCSYSAGVTVAYAFTTDKGNPMPTWITFDMNGGTIIYDTPNVATDQNYEFDIKITNLPYTNVEYVKVYVSVKAATSSSSSSSGSSSGSTSSSSANSVLCNVQNCSTCKTGYSNR